MYNMNVAEENERPRFLDMIPVKKYKRFTLYYKHLPNGNGYYECFNNQEIAKYKSGKNL